MATKNMRFKEHDIKKIAGKKFGLLGFKFVDDQSNEFVWRPKWDDAQLLLFYHCELKVVKKSLNRFPMKIYWQKSILVHNINRNKQNTR